MGSTGETSVKLILFSGKKGEWDDWYFGFEARAVLYRYDGILSGVDTAPTVAEYKTFFRTRRMKVKKKSCACTVLIAWHSVTW
jgi:hypothetical protein